MNHAIGLNAAAFGLGGGLFYLAHVLFEIPIFREWPATALSSGFVSSHDAAHDLARRTGHGAEKMLDQGNLGFY